MKKFIILIPIFNDRESLTKLIEDINFEIKDLTSQISIIVVNDASSQQITDNYPNTENINTIEIINMKENRGHARCNAAGLKYINEKGYNDFHFHRTVNLNKQSNKQLKIEVIQGGLGFKTLSELS